MSNNEFRNNLPERTSVKGEKERTQYGALGDSELGELPTQRKRDPCVK